MPFSKELIELASYLLYVYSIMMGMKWKLWIWHPIYYY